jgi:hypothetical protein
MSDIDRVITPLVNRGVVLQAFAECPADAVVGDRRFVAEGIGVAAPLRSAAAPAACKPSPSIWALAAWLSGRA